MYSKLLLTSQGDLAKLFSKKGFSKRYIKHQIITSPNESYDHVYLIESGHIKTYAINEAGDIQVLGILGKGNIFPFSWMLKTSPTKPLFFYEAFTDAVCSVLKLTELKSQVATSPGMCFWLLDVMTQSYSNLAIQFINRQKSKNEKQLPFTLYYLAMRLGDVENNIAKIDAPITQQDLADFLGVSRATISHEIKKLTEAKIFWKEGEITYINLSGMPISQQPLIFEESFFQIS